jgi:histidinol-phosphate aminotransferase
MSVDPCETSPSYVRSIAPYQPGKPISELVRELGLKEAVIVKLASNENPRGIGPRTRAAIERALGDIARYPDGNGHELKEALARRYGVDMAQIVLGNGSNDVLELVALAFLGPGRAAVYSQHAFAVYPLATQARGARGIALPAKAFGHDLETMARAVDDDTCVVWIANPNNPTGTLATPEALEAFVRRVPERVIVVIDEAYNEYIPADLRTDTPKWIKRHPNLVVTRTFSKAYGLAGLRVGYAIAHPSVPDVITVRDSIWLMEVLMISLNGVFPPVARRSFFRFSRMRSKLMIVSFSEYPITVRIAATTVRSILMSAPM